MLSKAYLDTARTLLRAAETMTDRSVACQLKALAEGYERQAEKAVHADAAKARTRAAAQAEHESQGGGWAATDEPSPRWE
jgi:SHS2 domain-containing protein